MVLLDSDDELVEVDNCDGEEEGGNGVFLAKCGNAGVVSETGLPSVADPFLGDVGDEYPVCPGESSGTDTGY